MIRRLGAIALTLVLAGALAVLGVFGLASSTPTGRLAPALPRERLAGDAVTLSSLLAEGLVGNAYRLTGLPTTFVIDSHGRIGKVLRGPQSEQSLQTAFAAVERS